MIGENQAEKCRKLTKHLASLALKDYGEAITHVVEYHEEYELPLPVKQVSNTADATVKKLLRTDWPSRFDSMLNTSMQEIQKMRRQAD